jgi:hypothetical protein
MPTTILADRYNTLRNRVNQVLGNSVTITPSYGYGQAFSTNSVVGTRSTPSEPTAADKISAQDYEDLYIDLIRLRSHQVGSSVAIDEFVIGDYNANPATADKIEEAYMLGLESLATNIITDRFTVAPANLNIASLTEAGSSRSAASGTWNGTLSHIFTVTFPNDVTRRHFFNAGGEIRLSASVDYTGSQAKTVDWQSILNAIGTTSFKAESTTNNIGIGSGSNIGNYDLTSTYQLVYSTTGGAAYSRNSYSIYATNEVTIDGTSAIKFKVEFTDGLPNNLTFGIDEAVFGTFNSFVETATPSSQISINGTVYDAVIIDAPPTGTTVRSLSGVIAPIYNTSAPANVNEGATATFTITTTDVANSTTLYWTTNTLTGSQPTGADFTDGVTSGSVVINNNVGTITRTLSSDLTTEGVESFSISLRSGSASGPILVTSSTVAIGDTSKTPAPAAPTPDPTPDPTPTPTPTGFNFSVSPATDMDFNIPISQGTVSYAYTVTCSSGSGSITVQEISRPAAWNVYVDGVNSPTASVTFSMSAGQSRSVILGIQPLTIGSGTGSFLFYSSTQSFSRSWSGTSRPAEPSISFTPSSGTINNTIYSLSWDDAGAGSRTVTVTSPEGPSYNTVDASGSIVSTLGIVGTWTASIATAGGTASQSVSVGPQPAPPPVIPPPSVSFGPSSGTINSTLYSLGWNANGATSATVSISSPESTGVYSTALSGSTSSTLGIVGTWSISITTPGGSASASVQVNP